MLRRPSHPEIASTIAVHAIPNARYTVTRPITTLSVSSPNIPLPPPAVTGGPAAPAPSAPEGQALEIELRHAGGHEVGDDARGAARHRPAHVAVSRIEEEVSMASQTEDRWPIRRHRPQAGAIVPLRIVSRVREQVARQSEDVVEVPRRPRP